MNSLLYNFSVLLLLSGLVLMVHYTTKIYYKKDYQVTIKKPSLFDSHIYQERPAKLFKNMFNNLGPWIGRTANPLDEEMDQNSVLAERKTEPLLRFE